MASLPIPCDAVSEEASGPKAVPRAEGRCLAEVATGATVCVVGLSLEGDLSAWLAAVGIEIGERLTVLRRAAFGGPLHVRTRSGGEFALNVALARSIAVESALTAGDSAA
jgi:ferrous iron transport protein A